MYTYKMSAVLLVAGMAVANMHGAAGRLLVPKGGILRTIRHMHGTAFRSDDKGSQCFVHGKHQFYRKVNGNTSDFRYSGPEGEYNFSNTKPTTILERIKHFFSSKSYENKALENKAFERFDACFDEKDPAVQKKIQENVLTSINDALKAHKSRLTPAQTAWHTAVELVKITIEKNQR